MDSCFEFRNINEMIDDILYRCDYEKVKITSMFVDEKVVHIELNKYMCKNVPSFFNHIMSCVVCSQNIFKPQYVTNHIIKEATLDVEGNEIIINILCNERFDKNADYK